MSFRDHYELLERALAATYLTDPVGSDVLLAWIEANEPSAIEGLRRRGYLDAEDPNRSGWSWRQYLGNALARLSIQGRIRLVGHSTHTPDGYYGPVGLWEPADPGPPPERKAFTTRLPEAAIASLRALAEGACLSTQHVVESFLEGPRMELLQAAARTRWAAVVREEAQLALRDADLVLPIQRQGDVMWFSYALTFRLALRLDPGTAPWSVCALQATLDRGCGPLEATKRVLETWPYEEGADLSVFTERGGRWWPLVATESEAAHWHDVHDDPDTNDYAWDFYKLFASRSPACVMVGRVNGHKRRPAAGRIEILSETLEGAYQKFRHLLDAGQSIIVVLVPGSGEGRALIGSAINPHPMSWEWWNSSSNPS